MDVTYEPGKTGNPIDQLDRHMKATEKELTATRAANALLALQLETARRELDRVLLACATAFTLGDGQTAREIADAGTDDVIAHVQQMSIWLENSGYLEGSDRLADARRAACAWKQSAKTWRETALSLDAELTVRREMEMEEQEVRS